MQKVTRSTLKSFLKKNAGNLYVSEHSRFDGMTDCVERSESKFRRAVNQVFDPKQEYTLGISGIWTVGQSRDSFTAVTVVDQTGTYEGIYCYNCCGSWTVAIKTK